jgi:uncharacterized protein YhdP
VTLEIAHETCDVPLRLTVNSQLQGMSVAMPAPMAKSADNQRDLQLEVAFAADGSTGLKIRSQNLLSALLKDEGQGFSRGSVLFGPGDPGLPAEETIQIGGTVASLELIPWVGWIADQEKGEEEQGLSVRVELAVDKLNLQQAVFDNLSLKVNPVEDGWQVQFDSKTLAGLVWIPGNLSLAPVVMHFTEVELQSEHWNETADQVEADSETEGVDPRDLPGLDLLVDNLVIDKVNFGKALMQWDKTPTGIHMRNIGLAGDNLDVTGSGHWNQIAEQHSMALILLGQAASLEKLERGLGLELGIKKAPVNFSAELTWPEPPHDLSLGRMSGWVDLKFGAGEVKEVDPGVGRLVGLLSLNALGKRLLLDFSDFFAQGLSFDRIEGRFDLEGGDAYTVNMKMVAPSATIGINGRTGLVDRDYDQLITVTPKLSSTLPVLGALTINPTTGLILALVQTVLGSEMDKVTSTRYLLSGSWSDPQIKKIVSEQEQERRAQDSTLTLDNLTE